MDEQLERRAGKAPEDQHPLQEGGASDPDPSDYSDVRVAQPGEDPPGEDALKPIRPDSG